MQNHAITIKGHRTSISLEPEFWQAVKDLAAAQGRPLAQLVAEVDADRRPDMGLSSALRLYVLRSLLARRQ
jgi:predicted DNA-binding ribbon-helix-helix protein